MRIAAEMIKELPINMQEQVALAILSPVLGGSRVAEPPKTQKVTVRRMRFASREAVKTYKRLRKAVDSGEIRELCMKVNEDGRICRFTYEITEGKSK